MSEISSKGFMCGEAILLLGFAGVPATIQAADKLAPLDVTEAFKEGRPFVIKRLGALAGGGREIFRVSLQRVEGLDLRVAFEEAPFSGTRLDAWFNGHRLVPYFAFGGDTRYDNVKGKPGARPPGAII